MGKDNVAGRKVDQFLIGMRPAARFLADGDRLNMRIGDNAQRSVRVVQVLQIRYSVQRQWPLLRAIGHAAPTVPVPTTDLAGRFLVAHARKSGQRQIV